MHVHVFIPANANILEAAITLIFVYFNTMSCLCGVNYYMYVGMAPFKAIRLCLLPSKEFIKDVGYLVLY